MLLDEVGGRRRCGAFAAALVVAGCALIAAPVAGAEQITVNSILDKADAAPGVGCLPAGEECTLRAAIETANGLEFEDEIVFDEEVFDGGIDGTIDLGASLPAISEPVFISGDCIPAGGSLRPCVGIDGPDAANPALIVNHTDFVTVEGVAVTGAQTGIRVISSEFFKIAGSWLGVKLDGSPGGNGTGIFFDPESNNGRVGGEGPGAGNVFANNTGEGLDVLGADNARIRGNYFGVKPDGVTAAANGEDVEVTSSEEFEATGTAIGTRVTFESSATSPECDGGCNVISGAGSTGIDLEGDGGLEFPAASTTILGNYIGLNAVGTAAVPNASVGIRVGQAARTVIGGPKVGEANRINGGGAAVLAGPAAEDLVIRGNRIGVNAAGTGALAPPEEGIVVNSQEFSSAALEALIAGNEIRMEGGVAISQQGFGARISGNEISGAETGIRTFQFSGEHGNLIEGNSIEDAEVNGILVENGFNEILGNEISGAGGAAIRIQGSVPFDVTENLVGGDAAMDENVIAGSGGDAIEIVNVEETENEVARNRGFANGGSFIDLVPAGLQAKGPNGGIEPPTFSTATSTGVSGGGAEEGARVRVFRKQSGEAGELGSFLGEAVADAGGNWQLSYGGAIPGGTIVAATQTSKAGGTSELSVATTSGGSDNGEASGAGPGPSAASPPDDIPPKTRIVKGPKGKTQGRTVQFRFNADEPDVTFQCKLDGKRFRACKSPLRYEDLKPGKHVFRVRAIDAAGNRDSSPAKREFTVQR